MRAELTMIGVCGSGRCAPATDAVVDALRPVVRDAGDAVLVRTTGRPQDGACEHADGTYVLVQRCTDTLVPVGRATRLVGADPRSCARTVRAWLRGHRVLRG